MKKAHLVTLFSTVSLHEERSGLCKEGAAGTCSASLNVVFISGVRHCYVVITVGARFTKCTGRGGNEQCAAALHEHESSPLPH